MNKERHGFLPMAIGLMLILLAIAAYQYVNYFAPSASEEQAATSSDPGVSDISTWKTYTDSEYDYSIQYPADFTLIKKDDNGICSPSPCGDYSIVLSAPLQKYFKTKLINEATLTIYWPTQFEIYNGDQDRNYDKESTNLSSPAGLIEKKTWSDVAAGNNYKGVDYIVGRESWGQVIVLSIHSANDAGLYPDYDTTEKISEANSQHASDVAAFMKLTDQIVSTFTTNNSHYESSGVLPN